MVVPPKSFKLNIFLVSKTMVTWLSPILSPKYRPHVNVKSVVRFVLQFCQEASKMATSWFAVSEVLENNQIIIGEASCQRFKILWTIIARNLHTFWGDFPYFPIVFKVFTKFKDWRWVACPFCSWLRWIYDWGLLAVATIGGFTDVWAYGLKTEPAFCMFLCLSWG